MSSFSSCLMQMTYVFSHSILFKRWVGGFRVFYDAMFEICPPSHTLFFLYLPMKCHGFFVPECRFLFHPYSIPPNEDGRKAPTLLRKRMDLCAFHVIVLMCRFLSALCFTVFACEFLNTAFSLRMRFELPFYGTFANYLRWVVCCLSLLLLWRCCYFGGFYVKGNNGF